MAEVELTAGTIGYEDRPGEGPVVLLLHGLLMNGSIWDQVVAELPSDYRCIRPDTADGRSSPADEPGC
jgi:pimeloyl-ACP methyl ester carboxylesterase